MFKQLNPILPVKEILKEINGLADEMAGLSNLELKNKTQEFKERLAQGESLDDLLPEAFAVVREADKRVLGMFPYDCLLYTSSQKLCKIPARVPSWKLSSSTKVSVH